MLAFAALADPVRREIVERLADGEVGAGEIAGLFPVSRPAVSRHLRVLREAGLVRSEVRAQRRVYRLDRVALAEVDAWLERFRPLDAAPDQAIDHTLDEGVSDGAADATPRAASGPAGRLDALDTEIRRGRRERAATPTRGVTDARPTG